MYPHLIRAKITPFKHNNRIQDIVSRTNALTAKLHGSEVSGAVVFMPVHRVEPLHKMQPKLWGQFTDNAGRAKSSKYDHVMPSAYVMPGLNFGYTGGVASLLV